METEQLVGKKIRISWTLNLSTLILLLPPLLTGIFWIAKLEGRTCQNSDDIKQSQEEICNLQNANRATENLLMRLDERTMFMVSAMQEMKGDVRKLAGLPHKN